MSDTVKGALIIGICLMLGLWGAGWLSKSDVGRYQRSQQQSHSQSELQKAADEARIKAEQSLKDFLASDDWAQDPRNAYPSPQIIEGIIGVEAKKEAHESLEAPRDPPPAEQ